MCMKFMPFQVGKLRITMNALIRTSYDDSVLVKARENVAKSELRFYICTPTSCVYSDTEP